MQRTRIPIPEAADDELGVLVSGFTAAP